MSENEKYRNMVDAFRMSELQNLMIFAGRSKAGRKTDLQVSSFNFRFGILYINFTGPSKRTSPIEQQ